MTSRVIPVRIDDKLLELIDELVRMGIYSSRSEAIRDLIRFGLRRAERVKRVYRLVELLFELERREEDIPVKLEGALSQLLSERGRF